MFERRKFAEKEDHQMTEKMNRILMDSQKIEKISQDSWNIHIGWEDVKHVEKVSEILENIGLLVTGGLPKSGLPQGANWIDIRKKICWSKCIRRKRGGSRKKKC